MMIDIKEKRFAFRLKLSGLQARNQHPEVSQLFTVGYVELNDVDLSFPPSVFAALPQIIRNPENLRYNNGIQANDEILRAMIDLTYFQPPVKIEFVHSDGKEVELEYSASDSLKYVGLELAMNLGIEPKCLMFRRSIEKDIDLLLPLCNIPISLFHVPRAKWSLELRWIPEKMNFSFASLMLLRNYLAESAKSFETGKGIKEGVIESVNKFLNEPNQPEKDKNKFIALLSSLNNDPKYEGFRCRNFMTEDMLGTAFYLSMDGKVRIDRGNKPPHVTKASDLVIRERPEGVEFIYGNKSIVILRERMGMFLEFINLSFMGLWESVEERDFHFDPPARHSETVPRVFSDSRINFIKPEKLQEAIDKQQKRILIN